MSKAVKWQMSFNGKCHQMSNALETFWNFSQLLAFFGATSAIFCTFKEFFTTVDNSCQLLPPFDNFCHLFGNSWYLLTTPLTPTIPTPQTNHKSWILEEEDIDVEQDDHGKGEGDAADDVDGSDLAASAALGELLCDKIQDEVEAGEADEEEYMQF